MLLHTKPLAIRYRERLSLHGFQRDLLSEQYVPGGEVPLGGKTSLSDRASILATLGRFAGLP